MAQPQLGSELLGDILLQVPTYNLPALEAFQVDAHKIEGTTSTASVFHTSVTLRQQVVDTPVRVARPPRDQ